MANIYGLTKTISSLQKDPYALIKVAYPQGATCTCTKGTTVLTAKDTYGSWIFEIPESGDWIVMATMSGKKPVSEIISITKYDYISVTLEFIIPGVPENGIIFSSTGVVGSGVTSYMTWSSGVFGSSWSGGNDTEKVVENVKFSSKTTTLYITQLSKLKFSGSLSIRIDNIDIQVLYSPSNVDCSIIIPA